MQYIFAFFGVFETTHRVILSFFFFLAWNYVSLALQALIHFIAFVNDLQHQLFSPWVSSSFLYFRPFDWQSCLHLFIIFSLPSNELIHIFFSSLSLSTSEFFSTPILRCLFFGTFKCLLLKQRSIPQRFWMCNLFV